ncbi:hypothetical protein ACFQZI_15275 [Mucilaginibacter lutimaris]|uniref:Uncharacterized protein n=1 Tax=Mucilaginibacter lutimaris TaxID=931629 RepID=A0ABW2ZJ11_9SPHI
MNKVKQVLADHLGVKKTNLEYVQLINGFGFSDKLFNEMSEILSDKQIEILKKSKYQVGLDPLDSIFIYSFTLSNKKHFAVIYDYYELYLPNFVWDVFTA